MRADWPCFVVEIEDRRHSDAVHIRVEVRIERSNVAPVESLFFVFVDEIERVDTVFVQKFRQNVMPEIV